jgi:hypothetical protein
VPGAIVPLYTDPGPVWDALAKAIVETPDLPFAVILNPDSGAGTARNDEYVCAIPAFSFPNVRLYGYIDTAYGKRDPAPIAAEIDNWKAWYGIDAIFFDDVDATDEVYYQRLCSDARAQGVGALIGNPGTPVARDFARHFDTVVVYEDTGYPELAPIEAAAAELGLDTLAILVLGSPYDDAAIDILIEHAHWIYVSERSSEHYETLPLVFDTLLDRLHIANAADFELHPGL